MAERAGTIEAIATELARVFEPLVERLEEGDAKRLIQAMGIDLPHAAVTPQLSSAFQSTAHAAEVLPGLVAELVAAIEAEDFAEALNRALTITEQVAALIQSAEAIGSGLSAAPLQDVPAADLTAFVNALPGRLTEMLIVEHLQGRFPLAAAVMSFFGVIEVTRGNQAAAGLSQMEFDDKRLRLDRIGQVFSDPGGLIAGLYGWGAGGLDADKLILQLGTLMRAMGLPTAYSAGPDGWQVEVLPLKISPLVGGGTPGLRLQLMESVADGVAFSLDVAEGFAVGIHARGSLTAATGVEIRPPADIVVDPPSGTAQGSVTARVEMTPRDGAELITLIGLGGSSGLFAEKIAGGPRMEFNWSTATGEATGDVGAELSVEGGKLRISTEGADGFLAELLSGVEVESDFDITVGWSAAEGIHFSGSHDLSIRLPSHVDLGPVKIDGLTLTVGIDGADIPIVLSADIGAELGPMSAVIEQLGAGITLSFPGGGDGNAGPVQIDFAFKPPTGAGLAIDAGAVKGGGYLSLDHERGEYAGALELDLAGIVAVKAIGIINTKVPGGYSLLIVITAEFGTGIQLGFGFTLLGVGGILGLNRTMELEEIAEGVRTGAIDGIMFPEDVVANAQRIISDLRSYFPPEEGTFLVGPLAKIGWGTPTLVQLSLGVIIEIPPGNIAILGVLKVALPDERAAILILQVSFIGAIEFDKSRAWFFASLFGSRVLFMTFEGDMGLLIAWGDDANFVVSVGGFHPVYDPPALPFPSLRRVSFPIMDQPLGTIRVEAYFAVTSNTAQFGARLEMNLGFPGFRISGHLGLDALFQFSPFYFIIQISGSLSLKVVGISLLSVNLKLTLEGPTPWRARGKGSVKLLFFTVSADFDVTWGESKDTALPPVEVLPIVAQEFLKLENWQATPPPAQGLSVTLRTLPETALLVLHPLGTLRISQRKVPLEISIDKVGNQSASDAKLFEVEVAGGSFADSGTLTESFAIGQYQSLSKDQQLSRSGYEPETSGLELSTSGDAMTVSKAVTRTLRYELSIIDTNGLRFTLRFFGLIKTLFTHMVLGSIATQHANANKIKKQTRPFDDMVEVVQGGYAVAFQQDNTAVSKGFASYAQAERFLAETRTADPAGASGMHIIETHELNEAA